MRSLKFMGHWLQIAGGAVALTAVMWLLAGFVFHLKLLNVQTSSMVPTFRPGDALVMQRLPSRQLVPGMVVSYRSSRNPNELVTHRVIKTGPAGFQTKGDALARPDPAVRNSLLAGRVVVVLPHLGRLLGWIQTLPGLIVCVYLPAFAIVVQECVRLERTMVHRRMYRLYHSSANL